jgi:hypothetical protein
MRRLLLGSSASSAPAGDDPGPDARVSYESDGRCGHVRYRSRSADFRLYYEFGGGDCIASIQLPSTAEWTRQTGLPLARRDAVVAWIGQQVVRDQCRGKARVAVERDWLNLYTV